jgi:phosphoadenosine phosphosulfate reductase
MTPTAVLVDLPRAPRLGLDEIETLNRRFETASPEEIIAWAVGEFGSGLCLTSSFADTVLIDLAVRADPDVEVVFCDTGFHFAETLETLRRAMVRYELNLRVERPDADAADLFGVGTDGCCLVRKVQPLERALADKVAWMSGLRRADSPDRAGTPIVQIDKRGLVKVNPLAGWTDAEVDAYIEAHDVIVNPLVWQGYPSIGCWPCTGPASADAPRAGRWAGESRTECGIHL